MIKRNRELSFEQDMDKITLNGYSLFNTVQITAHAYLSVKNTL